MYNQFNQSNQGNDQDDGWFERYKADQAHYIEEERLRAQGTSREQIAAEAQAEKERKAAEDKAVLDQLMKEKFEQLPEGQREIYNQYAETMQQALDAERAKNEQQLEEDTLNRQALALGEQYASLSKNASQHKDEIAQLQAQLQEVNKRLKQIAVSKPRELSNDYINFYAAGSQLRKK